MDARPKGNGGPGVNERRRRFGRARLAALLIGAPIPVPREGGHSAARESALADQLAELDTYEEATELSLAMPDSDVGEMLRARIEGPEPRETAEADGDDAVRDLQALDAVASERGMVLAFRVCEGSGDLAPVFLRILSAEPGEDNEATLISVSDEQGRSLDRYVVPRSRLDAALAEADDVDADATPTAVPPDWEADS